MEPQGDGKKIRIGLVGFGIRGKQLMRAAGFAEPSWIDKMKEANKLNKKDTRYQQYMEQDDLNIEITAVCDIFDVYGEAAVLTGSNIHREGSGGKFGPAPKRYRTYQELVTAPDVDAVIIAVRTTGIARSLWLRHVPESMYIARNRYHGRFLRRIWFAK